MRALILIAVILLVWLFYAETTMQRPQWTEAEIRCADWFETQEDTVLERRHILYGCRHYIVQHGEDTFR